jgi:hypothetical protein
MRMPRIKTAGAARWLAGAVNGTIASRDAPSDGVSGFEDIHRDVCNRSAIMKIDTLRFVLRREGVPIL